MTWYRDGTIAVSNGGTAITGTGTAFIANVNTGDAIILPDGRPYEITAVTSDTGLTIATGYLGSTVSGGAYAIQPTRALTVEFTTQATALIAQVQGYVAGVLAGKFPAGTAGAPAVAFADDPDTGVFRAGANQLGVSAGGVRRLLLSTTAFQVDVPLTGTAVQSSATDNTPGRLLVLNSSGGSFGIGAADGVAAPNDDADDCVVPGFNYRFSSSGTNTPQGNPFGSSLQVFAGPSGRLQQIYLSFAGGGMWMRASTDGGSTWTDWATVYTEATIVGTVSQSGGVPTGAVIERGSNANGSFVKCADGTMECWHTINLTAAVGTSSGLVGFRNSSLQTWTYPAAFVATPSLGGLSAGCASIYQSTNLSATGFSFYFASPVSVASGPLTAFVSARGHWF